MNTNPGPDDARQPGRSFSDAVALFQPIIPAAGAPVVVHTPVAPPLDDELPPATGPQPIPDAPRVPPAVTRADSVAFRPVSVTQGRPAERAPDVRIESAIEASQPASEPVHQAVAPPPPPRVRRRWWPVLAVPVFVAAIAGLAWLQPAPWQMPFRNAIQGMIGGPPAAPPERPAPPPAPVPSNPVAPAADAVAPRPAPIPISPPPSAAATVVPTQPDPVPPSPEPVRVAPTPARLPTPPIAEAAPQPAPAAPNATAASQPPTFPLVVVRVRAGSAAAQAEASRIAALLTTAAARLEVQAAPISLRTPSIRYFRAEDAAGARALASALPRSGTPWRVQRMRTPRNAVPGRFEVWLAEP